MNKLLFLRLLLSPICWPFRIIYL